MYKRSNILVGFIFVFIGLLFLLKNLNIFNPFYYLNISYLVSNFWPALFLILPGVIMHTNFFSGRNTDPGILVPGGILLGAGLTCQLSILFGISVMWPGFLAAVALGLFELYFFGTRDKALLIPVGILGTLSIVFFSTISMRNVFGFGLGKLILPLALIIAGAMIIVKSDWKRHI